MELVFVRSFRGCGLSMSVKSLLSWRTTQLRDAVQIIGLPWLVVGATCDIIIAVSLSVYLVGLGCCYYRAICEADIQLRRIDTRQA